MSHKDAHLRPAFSLINRLLRGIWGIIYVLFFRFSPRPMFQWRSLILKLFGAKLGKNCHIYPKAEIWAPWNLLCEDVVAIADGAIIYNPSPITLKSHSIVSQHAYLCGATHDFNHPEFPLISAPITLGAYSWICARASVQPGINIGDGAVLGLGAVATKDLEPWFVYAGIPARKIKKREQFSANSIK